MEHSKIKRIIDVNLNRATEGLRVVEEICRFILEDKSLTLSVKKLRGDLSRLVGRQIGGRNARQDVGNDLYTEKKSRRKELNDIFIANIKRAQEAIRCLEEFSKLLDPAAGRRIKRIRFEVYELEKIIAPKVAKAVKLDFDLYVVTDPWKDHLATIRRAVRGGIKMIQLRDKSLSPGDYFRLAKQAVRLTKKAGAVFILNDHWDQVNKVGADGVHLGQEDLRTVSLSKVRKMIGSDKLIGLSTHSFQEALKGAKQGVDYISVGPIFSTPSKPHNRPVGLKLLRRVLKKVKIPVVAIGGIDASNLANVKQAGGQRYAVIRAVDSLIQ